MTEAQHSLLRVLRAHCESEERRHPGSGGWVEWWDVVDDWGCHIPLQLVPVTASRVWGALERHRLIEEHPDPALRELIRSTAAALAPLGEAE